MKIVTANEIFKSSKIKNDSENLENIVRNVIKDVKINKDKALRKYTKKFDKVEILDFEIKNDEIKKAYSKVDKKSINILKKASKNIEFFAKKQKEMYKDFRIDKDGLTLGQKIIPIETVGCYVPGGRYPLVSSVLMSVIPAKVAGVKNIIVCSPKITSEIIVAADMACANKIYNIGGIQAIAAMAYGTKSIPKVDMIVGPGNKYVTEAKKQVFGTVGIDFIAGPSELLIIADNFSNPEYISADLLSQMEHDPNAKTYLITDSKEIVESVKKEIDIQIEKLITKDTAKFSFKNAKIIITKDIDEATSISNKIAPEHLEIQIKNPEKIISKLKNYGSLFLGNNSAEVFGDYCTGPNHILPTNGSARFTGGLSVGNFLRIQTYQKVSENKIDEMVNISSKIAEIEGLDAHKKSAEIRVKSRRKTK